MRNVTGTASPSSYTDTLRFVYDNKDELTQEKFVGINYVTNYAYDDAGNPTTFRGPGTRSYNANNQLITPGTNGGYGYDGNGNPTTYNGYTIGFDARDNATSIPSLGFPGGSAITAGYRMVRRKVR